MIILSSFDTFVLLCTFVNFIHCTDWTIFRSKQNVKLHDHDVIKTKTAKSTIMCASMCATETSFICETCSWKDSTCLLSNKTTMDELIGTFDNIDKWITYNRALYPVFLVEGVNGHYSLTFEEGKAECDQRRTTVASRDDLLEARGLGLHLCECGWLSDGTGGFVLQYDNGCSHVFHTGIIDWCTEMVTMDVYCKT